jgi:hypothetical protein
MGNTHSRARTLLQGQQHPIAEPLPPLNEKNPGKTGVFGFLERFA